MCSPVLPVMMIIEHNTRMMMYTVVVTHQQREYRIVKIIQFKPTY
jgi:hypothetical protein